MFLSALRAMTCAIKNKATGMILRDEDIEKLWTRSSKTKIFSLVYLGKEFLKKVKV